MRSIVPNERFGHFELTDEHEGELLDRIPVVPGEIRIADRVHLQPDRIANVLRDGRDVMLRAAWKNARWQQENGEPFDLLNAFRNSMEGADRSTCLDRPQAGSRAGAAPDCHP